MKFVDYYGDDRLRHKIVYNRNSYSECVYCGAKADTREHVPSKVFLDKPYPDNLGIVPACFKCNNSFSKDELFLSILIEKLKRKHFGQKYVFSNETTERLNKNKKLVNEIETIINNNNINECGETIKRILFKLAIGHAVFEVSEGYCAKEGTVHYKFLNDVSDEEFENFTTPFIINDHLLPEIGSRAYERIMIVDVDLASVDGKEQRKRTTLALLNWVDVQKSKYVYTCYKFEDEIIVKMIINEFLLAKVILVVDDIL